MYSNLVIQAKEECAEEQLAFYNGCSQGLNAFSILVLELYGTKAVVIVYQWWL